MMRKIIFPIVIIIVSLCVVMIVGYFFTNMQRLNERKKIVTEQLNKIESIYKVARDTRNKQPDSDWGHPNPAEAITIINNAISELKNLQLDNSLTKYRDLSIDVLKCIKKHHELRISEKDPSLFDSKAGEIYLKQFHIEGEREKE